MSISQLYFSFDGRICRKTLWQMGIIPYFLSVFLIALVEKSLYGKPGGFLTEIGSVILLWPLLSVVVKRCHDRNKSGWWVIVMLIPTIGWLWALIELGLLKGTRDPNQYGLRPL